MADKTQDKADVKMFRVMHEGVGRHFQGDVVSLNELGGRDASIPRLKELGAIAELSQSDIDEHARAERDRAAGIGRDDDVSAIPDGGSAEAHRPDLTTGNPHPVAGLAPGANAASSSKPLGTTPNEPRPNLTNAPATAAPNAPAAPGTAGPKGAPAR